MSQNDFVLANQDFPSMRTDMNSALHALVSNSSGTTEPATTYAYQMWYDETTDILKMRNAGNDGWISLAEFDQTSDVWHIIKRTSATGSALLPVGTTAQRDGSPAAGYIRFNSSIGKFEGYTGALWNPFAGAASAVQRVITQTNTYIPNLTTAIPIDDTIPQNTEGAEILTVTITPTNAANKLRIEPNIQCAAGGSTAFSYAIFQDSTADAIAFGVDYHPQNGIVQQIGQPFEMVAGTTSATTFKVRLGSSGGTRLDVNGNSAGRTGGGKMVSSLTVTEYEA